MPYKLKYFFIPELLVIDSNDDTAPLPLAKWLTRQLLTARLHHQSWPIVALHGIATTLFLLVSIINGAWVEVITYEIGCLCLLIWIERIALQKTNQPIWNWAIALLPGQLFDGWATLIALSTRSIEWSGIIYQVTQSPRGVVISNPSKSLAEESS